MNDAISVLVAARNDENLKIIFSAISNQNDLQVIGIENDEANTIIKSERLKPDVLIMDTQPTGIDGVDLAPIIHRKSPSTSIIMICDRDEDDYAGRALKAGISGFLLKKTDMNKLIPVVKIVNMGGYYISSSVILRAVEIIRLIKQLPGQFWEHDGIPLFFSPTELRIVNHIALGFSDAEIARDLHYSTGTIKNCLLTIKQKTKLKNRIQIVLYLLIHGLISLEHLNIKN